MPKYYEAYDKRYRQVHSEGLSWTADVPSPILSEVMERCGIKKSSRILELGCGEGRDALPLLRQGYNLLATDISPEAIRFCSSKGFPSHFRVLDACKDTLYEKFDFIYAVAVIHMLVSQKDRDAFLRFVKEHLNENGTALILTQGDGTHEYQGDPTKAFDNVERTHQQTGRLLSIASTSFRMVDFPGFEKELRNSGFIILETGMCAIEPDFPSMMYALIK